MTEKQRKILEAALELFAKEGYKTTSTSKVAKKAGVSEGLIFRHFSNKEGLLDAIIQEGEQRAMILFAEIINEQDPKTVLRNYFNLPAKLADNPEEANYWKLQYKIKWELEAYGAQKMEAVLERLVQSFKDLGYPNPVAEGIHLISIMDGMATQFFLNPTFDFRPQVALLLEKYDV